MCEPVNQWNTGLLLVILEWTWESRHLFEILISFPLDLHIYQSKIAGSHGSSIFNFFLKFFLIFNFFEKPHTGLHSGYTSLHSFQEGPFFPHILTNHLDNKQVCGDISLWFWFPFPWWLVILHTFSYTYWLCACLFWKNVHSGPLPIFSWIVQFVAIELYVFLIYFGY